VRLDLLDTIAVRDAVIAAAPDAIIHQVTALSGAGFARNLDRTFAPTNQLRTQRTDALLAAAKVAGVTRFVAQSFASLRYAREGSWVKPPVRYGQPKNLTVILIQASSKTPLTHSTS
jgi:nucleoside-diphosphate-sugar epimerase